jgi:hypothetical protein
LSFAPVLRPAPLRFPPRAMFRFPLTVVSQSRVADEDASCRAARYAHSACCAASFAFWNFACSSLSRSY